MPALPADAPYVIVPDNLEAMRHEQTPYRRIEQYARNRQQTGTTRSERPQTHRDTSFPVL